MSQEISEEELKRRKRQSRKDKKKYRKTQTPESDHQTEADCAVERMAYPFRD